MAIRKDKPSGKRHPHAKKSPKDFADALLNNSVREKMIDLLEQNPGMNKHQITQALGIHINTVDFHLQRLENAQMVETKAGTHSNEIHCFTKDDAFLWSDESTRILFGRSPPRQVAKFLTENPGTCANEISTSLGIARQTVWRHLKILEQNGLTQKLRINNEMIYRAEPRLVDWAQNIAQRLPKRDGHDKSPPDRGLKEF